MWIYIYQGYVIVFYCLSVVDFVKKMCSALTSGVQKALLFINVLEKICLV
jgi:hypothetical protein